MDGIWMSSGVAQDVAGNRIAKSISSESGATRRAWSATMAGRLDRRMDSHSGEPCVDGGDAKDLYCIPTGGAAGPDWIHEVKYDGYRVTPAHRDRTDGIQWLGSPAS